MPGEAQGQPGIFIASRFLARFRLPRHISSAAGMAFATHPKSRSVFPPRLPPNLLPSAIATSAKDTVRREPHLLACPCEKERAPAAAGRQAQLVATSESLVPPADLPLGLASPRCASPPALAPAASFPPAAIPGAACAPPPRLAPLAGP